MICAIDIGNTNITFGLFSEGKIELTFRLFSDIGRTSDEYAILFISMLKNYSLEPSKIHGFCISSVVPPIQEVFEELIPKYFPHSNWVIVGPGIKTGIPIVYNSPQDVGADRIANAVGAWEKYGRKQKNRIPIVVVDFGTAITFDCISDKGEYVGGAIFPGIHIAVESLFRKTAKLPSIEVKDPKTVIGKSTIQSIQAGIVHGYASMIDGMIEKIEKEFGKKVFTISTGGYAELVSLHTKRIDKIEKNLTLEGLYFIYLKNIKEKN